MKLFGVIGIWELVIMLVVVLIIFGPKNLPKLGKMFGKGAAKVRKGASEGKEKIGAKIDEKFEEVEAEKRARAADAEDDDDEDEDIYYDEDDEEYEDDDEK